MVLIWLLVLFRLSVYPIILIQADELVYGILDAIDGEKDPRCLMLTFHIAETLMQIFPDQSKLGASFASELFEILSRYFPIYFTHVSLEMTVCILVWNSLLFAYEMHL